MVAKGMKVFAEGRVLLGLQGISETYRCFKLGEKILSGKALSKDEREEVYRRLTGEEPPMTAKKGRPSKRDRDLDVAFDYLYNRDRYKRTDKLRLDLSKMYNISTKENTFYAAINRGIEEIIQFNEWWIEKYKTSDEEFKNDAENIEMCGIVEELKEKIDNYRRRNNTPIK